MKNKDLRGNGGWRKGIQPNRSLPPTPTLPTLVPPPPRNAGQGVGRLWYRFKFVELFLILFCLLATKWLIQST